MVFGFGKKYHFLGIDFGSSSIKAVEISLEKGRPVLINYGQINLNDLEKKKISEPNYSYNDLIVSSLKELINQMKPKSESVFFAMPAFTGLTFMAEFPIMTEDELIDTTKFEARKYIPTEIEDVVVDWRVVDRSLTSEGEKMSVLIAAILKKDIARFEQYASQTNLRLENLELEVFPLVRSVIGDQLGLFIVIDIGLLSTNILLVKDGIIEINRSVSAGGKDITNTIKDGFGVTYDHAETMKKSGKDFLTSSDSTLSFPYLQSVSSEVLRMMSLYQSKNSDAICNQVFLSGGTASFPGLTEYLSKVLNLSVSIADPWKNLSCTPEIKPYIEKMGASFSVAIGLVLYGVENVLHKKISLLQKKKNLKDILMKEI